jgi:hypothetical protein
MRIGFSGHRDKKAINADILHIEETYPGAVWVHGGAEGFDTQVNEVAKILGKDVNQELLVLRPDYKNYPGKYAPLVRNKFIVDICELLVVLWDGRTTGGTYQAMTYAQGKGIPILQLLY